MNCSTFQQHITRVRLDLVLHQASPPTRLNTRRQTAIQTHFLCVCAGQTRRHWTEINTDPSSSYRSSRVQHMMRARLWAHPTASNTTTNTFKFKHMNFLCGAYYWLVNSDTSVGPVSHTTIQINVLSVCPGPTRYRYFIHSVKIHAESSSPLQFVWISHEGHLRWDRVRY